MTDRSAPILPNAFSKHRPSVIAEKNFPALQADFSEVPKLSFKSQSMADLVKMVERVAATTAAVLIQGESGTGKELIAKMTHEKSQRNKNAFVAINCGALKDTLLESELFGHEKGSFTGAYQKKIGLVETAHQGTLFLDEIGELNPSMQTKLLRFLQEGEIYRIGGSEPIKVDVRIVCATNRNLETEVKKGRFRKDLFYRINTIVVDVPPLRRRKEDIPILVDYFLSKGLKSFLPRELKISEEALTAFIRYDWPGNVRELENVCERLQVLTEGHTIMLKDLPDHIRLGTSSNLLSLTYDSTVCLKELEKHWILKALEHHKGNKTQAALSLGVTIKTLYNKLHEYKMFHQFTSSTINKLEVVTRENA